MNDHKLQSGVNGSKRSLKNVLLKISQNLQENTPVEMSHCQ